MLKKILNDMSIRCSDCADKCHSKINCIVIDETEKKILGWHFQEFEKFKEDIICSKKDKIIVRRRYNTSTQSGEAK